MEESVNVRFSVTESNLTRIADGVINALLTNKQFIENSSSTGIVNTIDYTIIDPHTLKRELSKKEIDKLKEILKNLSKFVHDNENNNIVINQLIEVIKKILF